MPTYVIFIKLFKSTILPAKLFQYETQQSQLKIASDQLKRYLNVIHGQSAAPKTVNDVLKHLKEEVQVKHPFNVY